AAHANLRPDTDDQRHADIKHPMTPAVSDWVEHSCLKCVCLLDAGKVRFVHLPAIVGRLCKTAVSPCFAFSFPNSSLGTLLFLKLRFPPPHNHHSCCDIVTEAFVYSRKHKELKLYGWVIMPNHLHAV